MIKTLYHQYGELMIQKEIIDAQINKIKRQIADELNKLNSTDGKNMASSKEDQNAR